MSFSSACDFHEEAGRLNHRGGFVGRKDAMNSMEIQGKLPSYRQRTEFIKITSVIHTACFWIENLIIHEALPTSGRQALLEIGCELTFGTVTIHENWREPGS